LPPASEEAGGFLNQKGVDEMKKLLLMLIILCLTMFSANAPAADVVVDLYTIGGVAFTNSYSLLTAVTTTGTTGDARYFKKYHSGEPAVPISKHMFTAIWSGVTPSNLVFTINCSQNGTNYGTCASVTMTESPTIIHMDKPGVTYVSSTLVSRSNGSTNTAITVTGTSGGL
jgi:hypothetical protein